MEICASHRTPVPSRTPAPSVPAAPSSTLSPATPLTQLDFTVIHVAPERLPEAPISRHQRLGFSRLYYESYSRAAGKYWAKRRLLKRDTASDLNNNVVTLWVSLKR